jgi:uncharacterized protein YjbI with pentapeptide repeats/energy-coupling factor transporter ATP-binding protein EcfA2
MAIASDRSEGGRDASARARGRGEVFPGLEAFIGVGVLMGVLSAVVVAGLRGHPDGHLLTLVGQGVGLGGILGLFVGLGRGVWRPGPAFRARGPEPAPALEQPVEPAPSPELWDPWLDHGRDFDPSGPEVVSEEPADPEQSQAPILARAAVRPRVTSPQTGEAIPLEDEIGAMIQEGRGGSVVIAGGPGSGKTTALQHLAAILPPWTRGRVRLFEDEIDLTTIASAGPDPLVVLITDLGRIKSTEQAVDLFKGTLASAGDRPSSYRLAAWTQDDAIEYLLANDREACASVMGRLRASRDFAFLDGIPELCAVVLDRMACDESIADVRTALRRELADRIEADPVARERFGDHLLQGFRTDAREPPVASMSKFFSIGGIPPGGAFGRLIRHRPAALLLAAERMAAIIEDGLPELALASPYPRELVLEVARRIAASPAAIGHLSDWIGDVRGSVPPFITNLKRGIHPLAASLLHAATPGWRPEPGCRPRLEGAYLDGAVWPGLNLECGELRGADLRDADLSGADFEKANAGRACFRGANLRDANLRQWVATDADLGRANLAGARARRARFAGADLSGACLIDAELWLADLTGTRIEGADFTRANLEDARLTGLPLRQARFDGARFGGADLRGCDLEGVALTEVDFHRADLRNALLTGSRMPGANLVGANLRGARLAEIDWPGACLRDADLRGANFHLGTTRSGLVGSPIACEGSRTGFYTDDDLDRHVRPAEEIRKANLRGTDLRGADIRDVDFYLVDLREARYTDDQARHFRRCRAILDVRTA